MENETTNVSAETASVRLPRKFEVRLVGRLVGDPQFRSWTQQGQPHTGANLMLAVDHGLSDTAFVPISLRGAQAERCRTIGKGSMVQVKGNIRTYRDSNQVGRFEIQAAVLEVIVPRPTSKTAESQTKGGN